MSQAPKGDRVMNKIYVVVYQYDYGFDMAFQTLDELKEWLAKEYITFQAETRDFKTSMQEFWQDFNYVVIEYDLNTKHYREIEVEF